MGAEFASPALTGDVQSDLLHRALAASGDSRCWLLIDQSIRPLDDGEPLAQALAEAGGEIVRVASPHASIDGSVMPMLARLDSEQAAGSAALRLSIDEALAECEPDALMHGAGRRIGGWLQSEASGAALASHMSRQMLQRRRDGRPTLLRWTDPAVLWAMWPIMSSMQQRTLLGAASACHVLDPQGNRYALSALGSPAPTAAAAPATPSNRGLALTDRQWQQLDAIGPLNQALLQLGLTKPSRASLEAARHAGMAAVLRASTLGFAEAHDLAAFAWRAIAINPRFDAHPLVSERIAKRQADDLFTGLVDSLDERDWARIALHVHESGSD